MAHGLGHRWALRAIGPLAFVKVAQSFKQKVSLRSLLEYEISLPNFNTEDAFMIRKVKTNDEEFSTSLN